MSEKPKARVRRKQESTSEEKNNTGTARFKRKSKSKNMDTEAPDLTEQALNTHSIARKVEPLDLSAFEDDAFDLSMDDIFMNSTTKRYSVGNMVEGVVCGIQSDIVLVDIQGKSEALLPVDTPSDFSLGDTVQAKIVRMDGRGILLAQKIGKSADIEAYDMAYAEGLPVDGTVLSSNKGGFSIGFGAIKGFCPISQITLGVVKPEDHIGQTYSFLITELKSSELIVSRRKIMEKEREAKKGQRLAELSIGMNLLGTILNITQHGAFVDLDGVDGLIPRFIFSEIAADLSAGDEIEVRIKSIQNGKISLTAPSSNPWLRMGTEFRRGGTYSATVTKEKEFGFFAKLASNLEGLLHRSMLSAEDVATLKVGEKVDVRIQDFDLERKRIELQMSTGDGEFVNEPAKTLGDAFGDVFAQFGFDNESEDNIPPKSNKRLNKKRKK